MLKITVQQIKHNRMFSLVHIDVSGTVNKQSFQKKYIAKLNVDAVQHFPTTHQCIDESSIFNSTYSQAVDAFKDRSIEGVQTKAIIDCFKENLADICFYLDALSDSHQVKVVTRWKTLRIVSYAISAITAIVGFLFILIHALK